MGAVAVEGGDVGLLQRDQVLAGQVADQRLQGFLGFRIGGQRALDLGQGVQQFLFGVAEQRGKQAIKAHGVLPSQAAAFLRDFGMSMKISLPCGLRPNSVPSETPPEQPLPKVKPQLPFSLKLSSTISLWLQGTTKRSS